MRIALLTLLASLTTCAALASPQSDFDGVYGDWKPDLVITQCRWTQSQLQNAYDVANGNPDFQYETRFSDDVQKEITRWKNGSCAAAPPFSIRRRSSLFGAKVVSVKGRGGPAAEVVRIRNRSKKTLSFRKAALFNARNRSTDGSLFPPGFKLRRGRTATVHVGCATGQRRPYAKGQSVWLCRRTGLFRDGGDIARLSDAKGTVVSQRGFGSKRNRPVF